MKETVFEIIQKKIETVSKDAVSTFNGSLKSNHSADLYRLGFTSSISVVDQFKKLNMHEVLRAQLIGYFGNGRVLHATELTKFEKQYNLVTHSADRFKDVIPMDNQKEIVEFSNLLKENKWNQGRIETDLYHIPITDKFLITAPSECFRKALNFSEMSKEEYQKWLAEDPIVWKRIFRFDPHNQSNEPTPWLRMVSAWGMESVLINNN